MDKLERKGRGSKSWKCFRAGECVEWKWRIEGWEWGRNDGKR